MIHDVSVVICAYTEKRWTELVDAVHSVQRQTQPPREIILVIDYNPALLRRAQEHMADITIIENGKDKGLSGARNSGWEQAQSEIIAYLDDDAMAQPDWIEQLAVSYDDPEVVGVGGRIVPLWETQSPAWFPDEFNWVIGCTYRGMPVERTRVRNVIGANMSIRRSILESFGGFRESFGCDKDSTNTGGFQKWLNHYAGDEETEFCIRVSEQIPNSIWLYASAAVVQHRVSVERTRWRYFVWRCYDEGLGKASLVRLHSSDKGLSSEKSYTLKTLPRGVARSLANSILHHDAAGIPRAGAIVLGLATTIVGYGVGSISSRINPVSEPLPSDASVPVEVR